MRRRELAVEAMFRRVLCTKRETAEPMSTRTSSQAKLEQQKDGRDTCQSMAKELTAGRRTAAEKNRRWGRLRQREAARLGSNDAHGRGAPGCESNWTEEGWLWRV